MSDVNYMSAESLEQLKAELHELKTVKRKELAERIGIAKEQGDLSENFEYQEAKDEQGANERKIANMEHIINNAVLIEQKSGGSDIALGTTFVAEGPTGKKEYEIVGPTETDPMAGKISNESPLGNAFLGKAVGDTATLETANGEVSYKIIEIK